MPHVPAEYSRYFEPFLGAGSLFLNLQPSVAILNDACLPLVQTWRAIQRNAAGVYREATRRPLTREAYYAARSEVGGGYLQRAGRFIYLNKGAFNGLYRVNLAGRFNVPWGAPKTSFVCDLDNLELVQQLLNESSVTLTSDDFQPSLDLAGRGDLVFLDPPYVTSHNNNGFIAYNEKIFSWNDQERLAEAAESARRRGATVLVTNANHPSVVSLYREFRAEILERPSTLAASSAKRGRATEVLLIGDPSGGQPLDRTSSRT